MSPLRSPPVVLLLCACACAVQPTQGEDHDGPKQLSREASMTADQAGILAAARAERAGAVTDMSRFDYRSAIVRLRHALRLIGSDYGSATMIDDSGYRELAAKAQEHKGQLADAATTLTRVLDARLSVYPAKKGSAAPE